MPYEILPGQKICFHGKNKLSAEKKQNENVDIEHGNENKVMETDEILHETANDTVNQTLVTLLKVYSTPLKALCSEKNIDW